MLPLLYISLHLSLPNAFNSLSLTLRLTDSAAPTPDAQEDVALSMTSPKVSASAQEINAITPGKATPNIWTVMQKWIFALPNDTPAEKDQKATLQRELEKTVGELAELSKSGSDGLILGHCDLLSGNVIQQLPASTSLVKPDWLVMHISYIRTRSP